MLSDLAYCAADYRETAFRAVIKQSVLFKAHDPFGSRRTQRQNAEQDAQSEDDSAYF